jgi:hypothetical protein
MEYIPHFDNGVYIENLQWSICHILTMGYILKICNGVYIFCIYNTYFANGVYTTFLDAVYSLAMKFIPTFCDGAYTTF